MFKVQNGCHLRIHFVAGITPMMEILDRYGGWPAVKGDNWLSDDWDWLEVNRNILHNGLPDDLILECRIRTDFMNSSKRIIQVKHQLYFFSMLQYQKKYIIFDWIAICGLGLNEPKHHSNRNFFFYISLFGGIEILAFNLNRIYF